MRVFRTDRAKNKQTPALKIKSWAWAVTCGFAGRRPGCGRAPCSVLRVLDGWAPRGRAARRRTCHARRGLSVPSVWSRCNQHPVRPVPESSCEGEALSTGPVQIAAQLRQREARRGGDEWRTVVTVEIPEAFFDILDAVTLTFRNALRMLFCRRSPTPGTPKTACLISSPRRRTAKQSTAPGWRTGAGAGGVHPGRPPLSSSMPLLLPACPIWSSSRGAVMASNVSPRPNIA